MPAFGLAGALFLGGGILAGIGSGMSRAKRTRRGAALMGDNHVSIGRDNRGQIIQAQGDVHVDAFDALLATRELRAALAGLDPAVQRAAAGELSGLESALGGARPDRRAAAERLERLTKVLKAPGALATAGIALTHPLGVVAAFVGSRVALGGTWNPPPT